MKDNVISGDGRDNSQKQKCAARNVQVYYGDTPRDKRRVGLISKTKLSLPLSGPSGTVANRLFLALYHRMNDTIDILHCQRRYLELMAKTSMTVAVDRYNWRAKVGMVFQKPNRSPKSIYDNVAYGPRISGLAPQ